MVLQLIKPVGWAGLMVCLLAGCSFGGQTDVRTLWGQTMGTGYTVRLVATKGEAERLGGEVRARLDEVNDAMSTYLSRSELSRFNDAPVGEWVEISPITYEVIQKALEIAETSGGAFDPTVGPLVDLWGFGPTPKTDQVPSPEAIQDAKGQLGWQAIELDANQSRVRKTAPRELDLSGIAKGFAVDQVADMLEAESIDSYLVEVGGELRFAGSKPDGSAWRVAIETPKSGERSAYRILEVEQGAMATSGDYRNYFEQQGVRYSHTLNPETGYPIRHKLVSVTVLGDLSAEADAYATAFLVLGAERALRLADDLNMSVYLIEKTEDGFRSLESRRFEALFGATPAHESL